MRLAGLDLITGDTAAAATELGEAARLNDADPSILFQYGFVLIAAARDDESIVVLRRAIAVDPYFAAPYQYLGRVLDAHGRTVEAIAAYQGFVDHATRDDPDLPWTVERITQLARARGSRN